MNDLFVTSCKNYCKGRDVLRFLLPLGFVNADEIARGLSPFNPDSVAIEAGRLMLKRIDKLLEKGETLEVDSWVILDPDAQAPGLFAS